MWFGMLGKAPCGEKQYPGGGNYPIAMFTMPCTFFFGIFNWGLIMSSGSLCDGYHMSGENGEAECP